MTKPEDQMKFEYFAGEQRSPEWYALRIGKIGSSRLVDWLAVSKQKGREGKPLEKRLAYERELLFERQFNTSFEKFTTKAMQDGIDFEDFVRQQYKKITGNPAEPCGAWFSDVFVASPDATVNADGLCEYKVVGDNTFTAILADGVPDKWYKQVQGQLWASKRAWCDFAAMNIHTRKVVIIRVEPDVELHDWFELIVPEPISLTSLGDYATFDLPDPLPQAAEDFAFNGGGSEASW